MCLCPDLCPLLVFFAEILGKIFEVNGVIVGQHFKPRDTFFVVSFFWIQSGINDSNGLLTIGFP